MNWNTGCDHVRYSGGDGERGKGSPDGRSVVAAGGHHRGWEGIPHQSRVARYEERVWLPISRWTCSRCTFRNPRRRNRKRSRSKWA